MTGISSSSSRDIASSRNADVKPGGKAPQGLDIHKQVMRSNAEAAQAQSYDPGGASRVFQEATDNDGDEAEALSESGQLRKKRAAHEGGGEAPDAKKSKSARPQAADASAQDDSAAAGAAETGGAAAKKKVARKNSGTIETASLSQRQESLVTRLVALPDDYRGLAAANTETTFDAVSRLEQRFATSNLWARAPDTQRASMTDQIVNTFREETTHA